MEGEKIHVVLLNATYMQIGAEDSILRELHEYFTFEVPGSQFMPLRKHGVWDGKKRLFNLVNQTLYVGLLPLLKKFASDREYTVVEYDDIDIKKKKSITVDQTRAFLTDLRPQAKNIDITPHPYQEEAIHFCLNSPRTTIVSPTSSGKSLIIYSLIRWNLDKIPNTKILLVVPTVSLVLQMYSDFKDYSTKNGWNVEENCHKIYAGQEKNSDKQVIITTWQSMQKQKSTYFQQFDVLIVDEVHNAQAKELTRIAEACSNAYIRYGFTGTLQDTLCHKLVILGHFGIEKKVIQTKELMDQGYISDMEILCLIFEYSETEARALAKNITAEKRKSSGKGGGAIGYSMEMDFIVSHEARMRNLVALILSLKNNTLVLFNLVDKHGKVIYNTLINEIKKRSLKKRVLFVSGNTPAEKREEYRSLMEESDDIILLASYGTTSTGVNIKNIHNVIFASPSKSKIKVLQSIGRGLRKNENKSKVRLFDVIDKITYKTRKGNEKNNYVFNHFWERWKLYKKEQFSYKIITRKIS